MNSRHTRFAAIAIALPLLAGCASTMPSLLEEPGDSQFGEANRQTMMAQVIDPDPAYEGPATSSGDHAADAIERYNTDKVKEPDSIRTTNVGSGGSSSGS